MKTMTANQKAVLERVGRFNVPSTVREIASDLGLPRDSVRRALGALQHVGAVRKCGVALDGGATWELPVEDVPF